MGAQADAIKSAFETARIAAEVTEHPGGQMSVKFGIAGRDCQTDFTSFGPEKESGDADLMAVTRLRDPLTAFGRPMDWIVVDGWAPGLTNAARSGKAREIIPAIINAAGYYIVGRWPDDKEGFVVQSASESENGVAFWSNEDGWTGLDDATVFTSSERRGFNLPMALKNDSIWRPLSEAQEISNALASRI